MINRTAPLKTLLVLFLLCTMLLSSTTAYMENAAPELPSVADVLQNTHASRSINAYVNGASAAKAGDAVVLAADLNGYEGLEVRTQWQVKKAEWVNIDGATELKYSLLLTEANAGLSYRLAATITGVAGHETTGYTLDTSLEVVPVAGELSAQTEVYVAEVAATTETGTEAKPEATAETGTETGAEAKPEATAETGTETGAEATPEATAETGTETGTEATPEATAETGTETGTEATPEATAETGTEATPATTPEEAPVVERKVLVSTTLGAVVLPGEQVLMQGTLIGFEGVATTFRWQYNDGNGWQDIAGANDLSYTYTASAETVNYAWRLLVTAE